jgi:hypothetical protein
MAASNLAVTLLKSTRTLIPFADYTIEVHSAEITTDANGDGSTVVNWEQGFGGGDVFPFVSGAADGFWYTSSAGATQATVEVSGSSTTGGSVDAWVLAIGPDPGR